MYPKVWVNIFEAELKARIYIHLLVFELLSERYIVHVRPADIDILSLVEE